MTTTDLLSKLEQLWNHARVGFDAPILKVTILGDARVNAQGQKRGIRGTIRVGKDIYEFSIVKSDEPWR